MPLSKEQRDKAIIVLDPLLKKGCYVCNGLDWKLYDEFIVPPVFDMEYKIQIEGLVVPFVLVICRSCGNSHIFNATEIGII
jgi:hypothetical protein